MKKIIFSLIAIMACMSINAQVVKVYKNGVLEKTYTNTVTDTVEVVFEEAPAAPILLPGKFSVSATKQVQFTKGNLYWDGSAFKIEANQTDYPTKWDTTHVGHFYWTKTAAASYAKTYDDGTCATTDKLFADGSDADHQLTVEGTSGLYVMSGGYYGEWKYLINSRAHASNLCKCGVTVGSATNCLIIAPDDYDYSTNPLKSSYSSPDEVTAAGLVCLPAAGSRQGKHFDQSGYGLYWSSTPDSKSSKIVEILYVRNSYIGYEFYGDYREDALSIRLVREVK